MLDGGQVVLGHRLMIGRQGQRDVARREAAARRIHRLHHADHLVSRRAGAERIYVRRLIVDHVYVAAAQRHEHRLHQGVPRLELAASASR